MCWEDVKIGRETYTRTSRVTIPSATWTPIALQQTGRVSLRLFWRANVGQVVIPWTDGTPPTPTDFGNNQAEMETIDLWHHGDLVRQPWWAYQSAGNMTVWVAEVFLRV